MANRTVAEELVFQLAELGVKQLWGITGDAMNAFTDALRRDGRMSWYTVRHEETAAFAASAQAEISGELAVCIGTIGPGALHLINGLYNAKRDRSPVLAITGQVPLEEMDAPYFQEIDSQKVFDDVSVFNATLHSVKQLPRLLQQAITAALTEKGVAHIAIPTDLAISCLEEKSATIRLPAPALAPQIDNQQLQQVSDLINQSTKPALLVGAGSRGYRESIIQLAEHCQMPVVHTLKGSEVLPYHHPHSIGGIGHAGTPQGLKTLDSCDCLLILGADFPYRAFLPTKVPLIQIDINQKHLGRRVPVTVGISADVDDFITAILPQLNKKANNPELNALQKKRDTWLEKTDKAYSKPHKKGFIHPQSVVIQLSEKADDDAIFIAEVGEVTIWAARHLRLRGKQRLIGSFNHGSLGVGLPAALGAQALDKKRQVISLCGDGAFGMLLADLVTASRYDLPLIAIVFNNQKFGFVELEMEASGFPRFATDLVNPDFAEVARACQCEGVTVKNYDELDGALSQALKSRKPTLVEVFVNPNELIIPPKMDFATAMKYMQGKLKEVLVEESISVLFER